jgi:hypothetical protein
MNFDAECFRYAPVACGDEGLQEKVDVQSVSAPGTVGEIRSCIIGGCPTMLRWGRSTLRSLEVTGPRYVWSSRVRRGCSGASPLDALLSLVGQDLELIPARTQLVQTEEMSR